MFQHLCLDVAFPQTRNDVGVGAEDIHRDVHGPCQRHQRFRSRSVAEDDQSEGRDFAYLECIALPACRSLTAKPHLTLVGRQDEAYRAARALRFKKRVNLVAPMLSGDKLLPPDVPASADGAPQRLFALVLAAACAAAAAWVASLGG